jgi:Uma2 family endonuclease
MVTTRLYTSDDLYAMGSDAPFELIQGELIRVSPANPRSNRVLQYINYVLYGFVAERGIGDVYAMEAGFTIEVDPDTVVGPDVAYVAHDRIPTPYPDHGFVRIVPNLIVEIVSPSDEPGDMKRKQAAYDRAGVPLVWWVDPIRKSATIYRLGEQPIRLERTGILDAGSVLPGFSLQLETALSKF